MDIIPGPDYHIGGGHLKPQTEHWLEMAAYDLGTAEAMFRSRSHG